MKRSISAIAFTLMFLFATLAEAREYKLINDPSMPAAAGKVNVSKDKNGNYRIKLEVYHLAKPTSLTPPKQAYFVWVQRPDSQPELLGELKVNDNLEGTLESTVPRVGDRFDVFVTAEDNPSATVPSEPRVLHTTVVS
jgi:hypothetical protein